MATLIFSINQSLDGYIDHDRFSPDSVLFRHFIDVVNGQTGGIYGRTLYELMRYWETPQPEWGDDEHAFADVWMNQRKWVVSRTLNEVGPGATLISDNIEQSIRSIRDGYDGEIEVGGPMLAQHLADWGLLDAYHIYLHPIVLGGGRPLFESAQPRLRLTSHEKIGEDSIRLVYAR